VVAQATQVVGATGPTAGLTLATAIPGNRQVTLGGDKGHNAEALVTGCRALAITPHVAQNINDHCGRAVDSRTNRHPGCALSQRVCRRVEGVFGWLRIIGQLRML
jgi:hypothetical protein